MDKNLTEWDIFTHLCSYVKQITKLQILSFTISKEFKQTSAVHIFLNNVDGFFLWANRIKGNKTIMAELLHYCCLLQESCSGHCTWSQGFHSHFNVIVPFAWKTKASGQGQTQPYKGIVNILCCNWIVNKLLTIPHLSEIALTKFPNELNFTMFYFPLIPQQRRQVPYLRFGLRAWSW